jgi:hypothetical protein
MDWQQLASIAIVIIAAVLLFRRELRRRKMVKLGGCGMDCGCSPAPKRGHLQKTSLTKS